MKKTYILKILATCLLILVSATYCHGASNRSNRVARIASAQPIRPYRSSKQNFYKDICKIIKKADDYQDQEEYLKAISHYEEALTFYREHCTETTLLLAQILNNIGMSYLDMEAYEKTYNCYNKALTIRKQLLSVAKKSYNNIVFKDISQTVGKSHHNIGLFYLDTKKPKEAIVSFEEALKTEWQHHVESVDTQYFLAWAYMREKQYQKSKALYEDILTKKDKNSYLNADTIAKVEKYLQKVTEKIENPQETNTSPSPFNMTTFPTINPITNDAFSTPSSDNTQSFTSEVSYHQPVSSQQNTYTHQIEALDPNTSKKISSSFEISEQNIAEIGQWGGQMYAPQEWGQMYPPQVSPFPYEVPCACEDEHTLGLNMCPPTEEKLFPCIFCGKKFSRKHQMKAHMRLHNGEKAFECTVCYKKFAKKEQMLSHMHRHMENTHLIAPLW